MRPINLLPPSDRPRAIAAAPQHASRIVLGVLGALLLAMAVFVFTKNQATDRRDSIAQAQQEKAEAEQRSQGLKAYGDFSQIKQTRVDSITQLATKRFDWERLMRELALVLPDKVWVTQVDGKGPGASPDGTSGATPSSSSSSSSSSSTASPGASTTAAGGATSLTLAGCAPSQKAVAETMVRLRSLAGAQEVDLQNSTAPAESSGGSVSDGPSGSQGCGDNLQFNATVSFAAPTDSSTSTDKPDKNVPSRLGGGA